jgi:hypothetical protein
VVTTKSERCDAYPAYPAHPPGRLTLAVCALTGGWCYDSHSKFRRPRRSRNAHVAGVDRLYGCAVCAVCAGLAREGGPAIPSPRREQEHRRSRCPLAMTKRRRRSSYASRERHRGGRVVWEPPIGAVPPPSEPCPDIRMAPVGFPFPYVSMGFQRSPHMPTPLPTAQTSVGVGGLRSISNCFMDRTQRDFSHCHVYDSDKQHELSSLRQWKLTQKLR